MDESIVPTIGVDNLSQIFQLPDGSIAKVNIMDTAGQERYDSINTNYYRNANCCLLVYDITSRKTFDKIKNYYVSQIKQYGNNIKKIILLGNKTDLKNNREITREEGLKLANENNYIFKETSCKTNYNVADSFTTLIIMTNTELKTASINISHSKINKENRKLRKGKEKKNKFC